MRIVFLVSLILHQFTLFGQFEHEEVLPDLEGSELIQALSEQYKPETVLNFAEAKDVMYGEIYLQNDSVQCVYSGHRLYLPQGVDPSSYLYLNGTADGINAEHTYPKSKGASYGNAESDLYNLFPSRVQVNADRGNLPFGEVEDLQTDFWYYLNGKSGAIPSTGIELYSELGEGLFEPREDHKGNVARAIFYFVTMYQEEVNQADPLFFEPMRETLCDWHNIDPVDSLEWLRNQMIAAHQSGRPNPFILDCSLSGRAYCDRVDPGCIAVSDQTMEGISLPDQAVVIFPNPSSGVFQIEIKMPGVSYVSYRLYDIMGNCIAGDQNDLQGNKGEQKGTILFDQLPEGAYLLALDLLGNGKVSTVYKKCFIAR